MKKRIWIIVVAVIVLAAVGFGWYASVQKKKVKPTEVTVEAVQIRSLVSTVSATGAVEPVTQVKVSAEIPGRIVQLTVKEGESVEKGQFLVELDPQTYLAALESATSGLRSARGQKEKAEADLRRVRELVSKGMASQSDLDAALAAAELYSGQLDMAFAEEKRARESLSKTRINAPMSGIISRLNKEIGEMTLGSQFQEDVILIVADLSKMQVRAEVDENDIVGVKLGDSASVEIDAFPDTTFRGSVAEISQSASAKSLQDASQGKNFDVKVSILDSVKGIRPGMSATVDIATDRRDSTLSVSLQCVAVRDKKMGKAVELKEKEKAKSSREVAEQVKAGTADTTRGPVRSEIEQGVFLLVADSVVWKPVRSGLSSDRHIEILDGIAAGDSIVSGPYRILARDLTNGMKVRIKKMDVPPQGVRK
ncbi:efflux RND transporter periplasmic adaptor subunit [candidate division KSB1 bacterium]|nr:MAG: efflux RND transporter periplasmic adaptor subunit [candidate division KSB1 bacterium]